jgi:hypothetical protein
MYGEASVGHEDEFRHSPSSREADGLSEMAASQALQTRSSGPQALHSRSWPEPTGTDVERQESHKEAHRLALADDSPAFQVSHVDRIEAEQACITLAAALQAMHAKIDAAKSATPGSEQQASAVGQASMIVRRLTKLNLLPQEPGANGDAVPAAPAWLRPLQHKAKSSLDLESSTELAKASLTPTQQAQALAMAVLTLAATLLAMPQPLTKHETIHDQHAETTPDGAPHKGALEGTEFRSPGTTARRQAAAKATEAILHGIQPEPAATPPDLEAATGIADQSHDQSSLVEIQAGKLQPASLATDSTLQQSRPHSFGVATGEMAGDWEVCVDPQSGTPYYYNSVLQTSSWVLPLTEEGCDDE